MRQYTFLKIIVITLTALTIVAQPLNPYYPYLVIKASSSLELIGYSQYSRAGTTEVYPGSTRVQLVVELVNREAHPISSVQGCFDFPEGITPSSSLGRCVNAVSPNGTYKGSYEPGEVFQLVTLVDVSEELRPGDYLIIVNVTYVVEDPGGPYRAHDLKAVFIEVSDYPELRLEVRETWWGAGKAYPGTTSATLVLEVVNTGDSSIEGGTYVIELPNAFEPHEIKGALPPISPGGSATLQVGGINVLINASPGKYSGNLGIKAQALTPDGVSYFGEAEAEFHVEVSQAPSLAVELIDWGWVEGAVWGEGRGYTVYVTLQNLGTHTLDDIVATLYLPEGVTSEGGLSYVRQSVSGPINYGDVFSVFFRNLNVSFGTRETLEFSLELRAKGVSEGSEFWGSETLNFTLSKLEEKVLRLVNVRWVYRGSAAEAYPTAEDITLELTLINLGDNPLASVVPELKLPEFLELKDLSGSCIEAGAQPGYTCTLNLLVDVSPDAVPGEYGVGVKLVYASMEDGAINYGEDFISFSVTISDPAQRRPHLITGRAWWGEVRPEYQFPGARVAPLHVEVINVGRYVAEDVVVTLKPLSPGVEVIEETTLCSTSLQPGISCTATYYVDLKNASRGPAEFEVVVRYATKDFGSFHEWLENFFLTLPVEVYASEKPKLLLVDYSWLDDMPAYPETEDAVLTVTLANQHPFGVTNVLAVLKLPEYGFSRNGLRESTAYVEGPIPTAQTLTLYFEVDLGDIKPGKYPATLTVEYTVESGGAALRLSNEFNITLEVSNLSEALEFITSGWVGRVGEPGTYGNNFFIALRNTGFPEIRGVVAEFRFPEGITSSITNSTTVRVTPAAMTLEEVPQLGEVLPTELAQIQVPVTLESFAEGSIMYFVTQVNIGSDVRGVLSAEVRVSFIDHWGTLREVTLEAPIPVLGGMKFIDVWSETKLKLVNREGVVKVNLLNYGTAPVYDLYIYLYPTVPNLMVKKSAYYVGTLRPGELRELDVQVYFNPVSYPELPVPITYGSVPFTAALVFKDFSGFTYTYNTTFSVIVEPYIEFLLTDLEAVLSGNVLEVSGTLINLGNAQAQKIEALISVEGRESPPTFIGDLDPGSQVSFSVELEGVKEVETVDLIIRYRDPYGIVGEVVREVPVKVEVVPEEVEVVEGRPLDWFRLVSVLAVVVFLAIIAYIIRSYLKRHSVRIPPPEVTGGETQ